MGKDKERSRNRLIAALRKSEGEEVRVELCDFKGGQFLGIRVWGNAGEGLGMRPTEKGLTVPLRMAEPLMHAIQQTLTEAANSSRQAQLFAQEAFYRRA